MAEKSIFLTCDAASLDNRFLTLRGNIFASFPSVGISKKRDISSIENEATTLSRKSATVYPRTRCDATEEQSAFHYHLFREDL